MQEKIDVLQVDRLTQAYCHAGYPAIAIPAGYLSDGRPIGVVFTGCAGSEAKLLAAGFAYEQATLDEAWRSVRPAVLRPEVAK